MFKPRHPKLMNFGQMFSEYSRMPDLFQRIVDTIRMGKPCLIVIDGKSQTGKSTLARLICQTFDQHYKTFFQVKDIIDHLNYLKGKTYWNQWLDDKFEWHDEYTLPYEYQNKFTFFDEPQIAGGSNYEFWSERNQILSAYTSTFGFLHQSLVMALPNIFGISPTILTNITMRIKIRSFLGRNKNIVRKAYIDIPNEFATDMKGKYFWRGVEVWTIPDIEPDSEYNTRKTKNFFDVALPEWERKLGMGKQEWMMPQMKFKPEQPQGWIMPGQSSESDHPSQSSH